MNTIIDEFEDWKQSNLIEKSCVSKIEAEAQLRSVRIQVRVCEAKMTCWRTEATDNAVHEVCVDDLAAALALQQIEDRGGETLLKKREHVLSPGDERELRTTHITGD